MPRSIKFRAWDVKNHRFNNGKGDGIAEVVIAGDGKMYWLTGLFRPIEPSEIIIDRFTGLRDKNGNEIFEGDILRFFIPVSSEIQGPGESSNVIVCEQYGAFGFKPTDPSEVHEDDRMWKSFWQQNDDPWNTYYFEVIGDIHSNPELLEAK